MKWRNLVARLRRDLSIDTRWRIGLAAAALLTHWLFHTRFAYSWDVADFILATRQFDLRLHLPHPLGYVVWVAMGRLALPLGLPPHEMFLAWNFLSGALGVVLVYELARRLWDRPTAIVAALLLLTAPSAWFYAGTGYADIWDATLGTALALLTWCQVQCRMKVRVTGPSGPPPQAPRAAPGRVVAAARHALPPRLAFAIAATLVYSLAAGIR